MCYHEHMIYMVNDRVKYIGSAFSRENDFPIASGDLGFVTYGNVDEDDDVTVIFDGSQDPCTVAPNDLEWVS